MYQHKLDAIRRYDENNPVHQRIRSILMSNDDIKYKVVVADVCEVQALNKERELISELGRVDLDNGPLLNRTGGGQGQYSLSEEQLEHRRKQSSKAIEQYSLSGELLGRFDSAKEAAEKTGTNRSYITQVCKQKRRSANGFLWIYEGEQVPVFTKLYYRSVVQISLDGKVVNCYASLSEAQQQTGVKLRYISSCCREDE